MATEKETSGAKTDEQVKGELVESIAEMMHALPGAKVERNVRLPPVSGKRKRGREIDVLISGWLAGYEIRFAIECKNLNHVVGIGLIDAFVGKLKHVGIPTQNGIFVTASSFTGGALERAEEAGIRPLIVTGLTPDRLAAEVTSALQSVVYLLAFVTQIEIINDFPRPSPDQLWIFVGDDGQYHGTILDLIWNQWLQGNPQSILGAHRFPLDVPDGWHQVIDGQRAASSSITVTVEVHALVLSVAGEAKRHQLIHAIRKVVEKSRVDVSFRLHPQERQPMREFTSEESLAAFLTEQPQMVRITTGRIRLPRIVARDAFWPPTRRGWIQLSARIRAATAGETQGVTFDNLDGNDLASVWDPLWEGIPKDLFSNE